MQGEQEKKDPVRGKEWTNIQPVKSKTKATCEINVCAPVESSCLRPGPAIGSGTAGRRLKGEGTGWRSGYQKKHIQCGPPADGRIVRQLFAKWEPTWKFHFWTFDNGAFLFYFILGSVGLCTKTRSLVLANCYTLTYWCMVAFQWCNQTEPWAAPLQSFAGSSFCWRLLIAQNRPCDIIWVWVSTLICFP